MKKASTLSHKTLKRPSNVFTVGENNCDFTDLVTALQNGSENDTFIVYGGVHDGKLLFRQGQSFHLIGDVTFKQSINDSIFQFIPASSYEFDSENLIDDFVDFFVTFSGSIPTIIPYSPSKWVHRFNDGYNEPYPSFYGCCHLRGLEIFRTFRVHQSSTNNPVLDEKNGFSSAPLSVFTNVINGFPDPSAVRTGNGLYRINFFPNTALYFHNIGQINLLNPDETTIITYGRGADNFTLDLTVKDYSGNLKDGFDITVFAKSPLMFSYT